MKNWFQVEQLCEDTFVISEQQHTEETHCYLLLGKEKALLIDTGLGVGNIAEIVETITTLPILVITTHVHWDHIGGHSEFKDIAVYESEVSWLSAHFPLPQAIVKQYLMQGFIRMPNDFQIDAYTIYQKKPTRIVHDLEFLDLGGRSIQVIHTPGHSPGHICLYEETRKTLYTGDLIYEGCLYMNYPTTDPIAFMNSIKRVHQLSIETLYPAHHNLHIDVSLLQDIEDAFSYLLVHHKLKQGEGICEFKNFSIYL